MRLKRGKCDCLFLQDSSESVLDGTDRCQEGNVEMQPLPLRHMASLSSRMWRTATVTSVASRSVAQNNSCRSLQADDDEEVFFTSVLHLIEIAEENEIVSVAGSLAGSSVGSSSETASDGSSDDETGGKSKELGRKKSSVLDRGSKDITPDGDALSEHEVANAYRRLRYRKLPDARCALQLTRQITQHLRLECSSLVYADRPLDRLIVVGDLHGHFDDLLHLMSSYGEPSKESQYLFNGDFIDRGVWGPEVIMYLFCLKLLYPQHVFLNRGNHESSICTDVYGFKSHLGYAYPDHQQELYQAVLAAFDQLPLCHVIGSQVCVMHGGLPKARTKLSHIASLERGPMPIPAANKADRLFQALLWSDPKKESGPSSRGIGWHFSQENTEQFLTDNLLSTIIRSHECIESGYQMSHGSSVITVFSASNYDETNNASVAIIWSNLSVTQGDPWNEEYVRSEWVGAADCVAIGHRASQVRTIKLSMRLERMGKSLGLVVEKHPYHHFMLVTQLHPGGLLSAINQSKEREEEQILPGDAIMRLNSIESYHSIVAKLQVLDELNFEIQRPTRLKLTVDTTERNIDLGALTVFPSLIVVPAGWAEHLEGGDCIVAVNGVEAIAEIMCEMKASTVWHMAVRRYASPTDLRETMLRRSSTKAWEDDIQSERRAVSALRARLGSCEQWTWSSKRERALEYIHAMIFSSRPQLMEAFEETRRTDSRRSCIEDDLDGKLAPERWADVMAMTLRTPEAFPWLRLGPYLYTTGKDGQVSYMEFLSRFGNRFARWLSDKWCEHMMDKMVYNFQGQSVDEFNRWGRKGKRMLAPNGESMSSFHSNSRRSRVDLNTLKESTQKLSYTAMQNMFQERLGVPQPKSQLGALRQSMHFFALFRTMDNDKGGFVTVNEFIAACKRTTATARQCPNGHGLEDVLLQPWQGWIHPRLCDVCWRGISRSEMRRHCFFCNYDLCHECWESRDAEDKERLVLSLKNGEVRESQWHIIENALYVLSASRCDVRSLFALGDPNIKDGEICRAQFVASVRHLLKGDSKDAEVLYDCVCDYLEDAVGWTRGSMLRVDDLASCFKIVDLEDAMTGTKSHASASLAESYSITV